jgi:hypothetical protein
MREYEFYEVMVDQSLITKAPICMADLEVKGFDGLLESNNICQRVLK